MSDAQVVVAIVREENVKGAFMDSLVDLMLNDPSIMGRISIPSGPNLSRARNYAVDQFLSSPATHMMMLDTDMVFEPNLVQRLLADRKDIVSGLYHQRIGNHSIPLLKRLSDDGKLENVEATGGLMKVAATGAGCLLVNRRTLVRLNDQSRPLHFRWFSEEMSAAGDYMAEDTTFCIRAGLAGFQVWVDTDIEVGHLKGWVI
jgi:hypothetical protein